MSEGYEELSEKEKQTLRLIVRGYDAKSLARHLEISVHTVNERLRQARRKMAVSSSREAARRLLEEEGETHNSLAYNEIGDAGEARAEGQRANSLSDNQRTRRRLVFTIGGITAMSLLLATAALSIMQAAAPVGNSAVLPQDAKASGTVTGTEVEQSARQWLALVDSSRWSESWSATGEAFRELNTLDHWAAVSEEVRPPLGAVISRIFESREAVPAPPFGFEMVKFRTSFADRPDVTETLTLVHENDQWRVVGYIVS